MTFTQNIKNQNCEFKLLENRIDVWRISLSGDHKSYERYLPSLSTEEMGRVKKYKITAKRYEFARVRSILRYLIKQYLAVNPENIKFGVNAHGKPHVLNHNIRFNVSHSYDCAVIGFTRSAEIGLDVEKIRTTIDWQGLSRRYFSKNEASELCDILEENQRSAFYTCWTRKEAFVKALGRGIGFGLDNFDVTFQDHDPPQIKEIRFKNEDAQCWAVSPLKTEVGYIASICYRANEKKIISQYEWQD